jgi:hypothetical protein
VRRARRSSAGRRCPLQLEVASTHLTEDFAALLAEDLAERLERNGTVGFKATGSNVAE